MDDDTSTAAYWGFFVVTMIHSLFYYIATGFLLRCYICDYKKNITTRHSNNLVLIFVAHSGVWTGWGLEEEWWRLSDWILWAQLYYYKRSVWFLVTKSSGCIVSSSGLAKHRQSGGIATGCHHFENVRQEREQRVVCFKWTAAADAVAMESKLISLMDGRMAAGWKSPKINCETTCQPTGWLIIAQRVLCSWYRQSNRVDTSAFIYTEQLVYYNRIIVISHSIGAKSKNYYMSWPRSNLQVNQL